MKRLAIALTAVLAASITSSAAFAGGDKLNCSSPDGKIVLEGSLWNGSGHLSRIAKLKGQKLNVLQVTKLDDDAAVVIDQDDAAFKRAIDDETKSIEQSQNQDMHYIVGPAAKPVYAVNKVTEACREFGEQEFTQSVKIVSVYLEWDAQLKKAVVKTDTEQQKLVCQYSFASAPGGGPECAH